jgi:hypothetical protein
VSPAQLSALAIFGKASRGSFGIEYGKAAFSCIKPLPPKPGFRNLTLLVAVEVKVDPVNFDIKLQENFLCTLIFKPFLHKSLAKMFEIHTQCNKMLF